MTTKSKAENTVLLNGGEVPKKFYDQILKQAISNIKSTSIDDIYISEQILSTDFWVNDLFMQDRQMAGSCIKDMAARNLIPYIYILKGDLITKARISGFDI